MRLIYYQNDAFYCISPFEYWIWKNFCKIDLFKTYSISRILFSFLGNSFFTKRTTIYYKIHLCTIDSIDIDIKWKLIFLKSLWWSTFFRHNEVSTSFSIFLQKLEQNNIFYVNVYEPIFFVWPTVKVSNWLKFISLDQKLEDTLLYRWQCATECAAPLSDGVSLSHSPPWTSAGTPPEGPR